LLVIDPINTRPDQRHVQCGAGTCLRRERYVRGSLIGGTLLTMTDMEQRLNLSENTANADDPSGRLAAYTRRTQTPLDLLALATLWIVIVPIDSFSPQHHARTIALSIRIGVSVIYGIDMLIRSRLATRHLQYVRTHPVGVIAVIFPPVRVIFSVRLITSMFQRGNLARFLLAAFVLIVDGAVIVYFFERNALHSNIHTLGESIWWSFVTVTTVGYGDFFPVTPQGRIAACFIMATGILTLAVVTAHVASSFVDQKAQSAGARSAATQDADAVTLSDLNRRLARIEDLLAGATATGPAQRGSKEEGDAPST
jgi:voltage-gated potassium channel